MKKLVVLFCLVHVCYGVIYRLNDSEFARMPPKYAADPFEQCHWDPDAAYCFGEFVLVSDTPSPLLDMIHEYSAQNTTHFNHTIIRRGICVTQSCKGFNLTSVDQASFLEGCLNESIYNTYKLKTRISDLYYCNQPPKDMQPDNLDIGVGIVCGIILLINLIGSVYAAYCGEKKDGVSRFLLCFTISRNWRKLTVPIAETRDPRLKRLKSIHGIRAISMVFVIMAHAMLACVAFIDNSDYLEKMYHFESLKIVFSGTMIMQTFLVMSGFLLVYNAMLQAEKHRITWGMLPQLIVLRWLRLTPPFAVVLALTVTWFRFCTSGPLWQEIINREAMDCRENWWMNLLYIINYNDESMCMQHTWYVAADTQLYCFGVFVVVLCSTPFSRKIFLPIIFVAGCVIPGLLTYYYNLDGNMLASPEAIHSIFMHEPTFNYSFRRGHTNLAGYTIGLSIGYLVYHWQKKGIDVSRLRRYRYFFPLLFSMGAGVIYSCSIFFRDGPRLSVYIRAASACVMRPTFGFIIGLVLIIFIFKLEDMCRRIVEWHGWTVPSRLSYSAYLVHVFYIRSYVAFQTTIIHTSIVLMNQVFVAMALVSFITAVPLFLLVEAPVGNLIREFITKPKKDSDKNDEGKQNGIKEEGPKKVLSEEEKNAIEKIVSLENLREILCVEGQTRF